MWYSLSVMVERINERICQFKHDEHSDSEQNYEGSIIHCC